MRNQKQRKFSVGGFPHIALGVFSVGIVAFSASTTGGFMSRFAAPMFAYLVGPSAAGPAAAAAGIGLIEVAAVLWFVFRLHLAKSDDQRELTSYLAWGLAISGVVLTVAYMALSLSSAALAPDTVLFAGRVGTAIVVLAGAANLIGIYLFNEFDPKRQHKQTIFDEMAEHEAASRGIVESWLITQRPVIAEQTARSMYPDYEKQIVIGIAGEPGYAAYLSAKRDAGIPAIPALNTAPAALPAAATPAGSENGGQGLAAKLAGIMAMMKQPAQPETVPAPAPIAGSSHAATLPDNLNIDAVIAELTDRFGSIDDALAMLRSYGMGEAAGMLEAIIAAGMQPTPSHNSNGTDFLA